MGKEDAGGGGVRVYAEDLLYDPALKQLKRLVDTTGAKIVVSSSWRLIPMAMKNLTAQLEAHGMKVYDKTPHTGNYRGDDITAWLNQHDDVDAYVILDDDSDMTTHMDHLVKTDFETGLRHNHVDRAIEVLQDG